MQSLRILFSFLAPTGALGVLIWDLCLSVCVYFMHSNSDSSFPEIPKSFPERAQERTREKAQEQVFRGHSFGGGGGGAMPCRGLFDLKICYDFMLSLHFTFYIHTFTLQCIALALPIDQPPALT